MIVSRNEVHGVLRKAALGAKLPAGGADDLAAAASWMEAHGHPALADALDYIASGNAANLNLAIIFDRLAIGEEAVRLDKANTLLIGFAAEAAAAYDMAFDIAWSDGAAQVGAESASVSGRVTPGRATVTRGETPEAAPPVAEIHIDDEVWRRANGMAAAYYVPATEASRLGGAGAGVNDND